MGVLQEFEEGREVLVQAIVPVYPSMGFLPQGPVGLGLCLQIKEGLDPGFGISGGKDAPGFPVGYRLGGGSNVGCKNDGAGGHGLGNDIGEAVPVAIGSHLAGEEEEGGPAEPGLQIIRGEKAGKVDPAGQAGDLEALLQLGSKGSVPDDGGFEGQTPPVQCFQDLKEKGEPLFGYEPADTEEVERKVRHVFSGERREPGRWIFHPSSDEVQFLGIGPELEQPLPSGFGGGPDKGGLGNFRADQPVALADKDIVGMCFHTEGFVVEPVEGEGGRGGSGGPGGMVPGTGGVEKQGGPLNEGIGETEEGFLKVEEGGTGITEQVPKKGKDRGRFSGEPIRNSPEQVEEFPFGEAEDCTSFKLRAALVNGHQPETGKG